MLHLISMRGYFSVGYSLTNYIKICYNINSDYMKNININSNEMGAARYMQRALELARQAAALLEVPVGAVIVKGGEIISQAYNTIERDKSVLSHAEIKAISQAEAVLGDRRLLGCHMYVTLEPCPMCAGAIINSRIEMLVVGALDDKGEGSRYIFDKDGYDHKVKVIEGIMMEECGEVMREFFERRREE